jgi:plastocyanin
MHKPPMTLSFSPWPATSGRGLAGRAAQVALCGLLLAIAGARAGELRVTVVDAQGKPVPDAVITATAAVAPSEPAAAVAGEKTVDQVDKTFVPYVTVVRAGTQIRFPNSDNIRHHVYSFSPAKRFELPLYGGTHAAPVLFDKAGTVVMGCNIHDWMVAYVYVADTPYFAKTPADGVALLRDLPPGQYTVRVWHPEMEGAEQATARELRVDEQGSVSATWTLARQEVFRPRRAPVSRNSGY